MFKKFAIHGLPRSGSTWIGEIFNSSPNVRYLFQPLFSYALKSYLTPSSTACDVDRFYDQLNKADDRFLSQADARETGKLPCFKKHNITHVGYKEVRYHNILPNFLRVTDSVKYIFIVRNPYSVIHSWLNAPKEFRADLGWKPTEEWRYALKKNLNRPEEFNGYEKWKEATLMFYHLKKQYPERVMLLKYDELLCNASDIIKDVFRFLELPYTQQTKNYLTESSENSGDPYSVMRVDQTDDKWKTQLDPAIINAIRVDIEHAGLKHLCA